MLLCNLLISFLGTNEEAIIYICTTRNNAQRQELKSKYKTSYGEVGSDHWKNWFYNIFSNIILVNFYIYNIYLKQNE
jgi:hypothetical protein